MGWMRASALKFTIIFALASFVLVEGSRADEVGNTNFVLSPVAKPIYVSKGGTKYWPCVGYVNPKLIKIIYDDLVAISNDEGVPPPDGQVCHYKIGTFSFGNQSIPTYQVDMYINKENMETCVLRDYCTNFRTATFKVHEKKLVRQYMITNLNKRLTRMVCVGIDGKVISQNGGC